MSDTKWWRVFMVVMWLCLGLDLLALENDMQAIMDKQDELMGLLTHCIQEDFC